MSDENKRDDAQSERVLEIDKLFNRVQPGGDLGPIEDRPEWEKLVQSKSPEERELLQEFTNFFDLLKYFEERGEKPGLETVKAMEELPKLALPERIQRLREINRKLMERVADAGEGAQFRQ
jgi:hypothetical protein